MNFTAGTTLQNGKYVLDAVLGQAEFATTYRATSTRSEQPVVIKTLNQELKTYPDFAKVQQRFLEEANHLKNCQHPNLARGLEVFEEAELPFLVIDYVSGTTLAAQAQSKPFPEAQAIHAIRQVEIGRAHV